MVSECRYLGSLDINIILVSTLNIDKHHTTHTRTHLFSGHPPPIDSDSDSNSNSDIKTPYHISSES